MQNLNNKEKIDTKDVGLVSVNVKRASRGQAKNDECQQKSSMVETEEKTSHRDREAKEHRLRVMRAN